MNLFYVLFIVCLFFIKINAFSKEKMTFVFYNEYYPYSYSSELNNNDAKGILPKYIISLLAKLNIQVNTESYPWERAQNMVKKGEADGFITVPTDARKEYALFANEVSFTIKNFLMFENKKLEDGLSKIKSLRDLNNFKVCDYIGNGWAKANMPGVNFILVAKHKECIKKLMAGEVDFVLGNTGFYKEQKKNFNSIKIFEMVFIENVSASFHIGIRKSYPNSSKLMTQIEKLIQKEKNK